MCWNHCISWLRGSLSNKIELSKNVKYFLPLHIIMFMINIVQQPVKYKALFSSLWS